MDNELCYNYGHHFGIPIRSNVWMSKFERFRPETHRVLQDLTLRMEENAIVPKHIVIASEGGLLTLTAVGIDDTPIYHMGTDVECQTCDLCKHIHIGYHHPDNTCVIGQIERIIYE